jgi:hypothetical protein
MARIFFSHASEDKPLVEVVYSEFVDAYPAHQPWVDRYEIIGGQSLIDKIAEGMNESERFFIFLSPVSVEKPWVKRELQRALMREIDGVDPDYIVPVRVDGLERVPPFLEAKKYIDLSRLTKDEWLAEFDAAISGTPATPEKNGQDNLVCEIGALEDEPHIGVVRLSVRAWAERFAFVINTSVDLVPDEPGIHGRMIGLTDVLGAFGGQAPRYEKEPRRLKIARDDSDIRPGRPVLLRIPFPPGTNGDAAITSVQRWG